MSLLVRTFFKTLVVFSILSLWVVAVIKISQIFFCSHLLWVLIVTFSVKQLTTFFKVLLSVKTGVVAVTAKRNTPNTKKIRLYIWRSNALEQIMGWVLTLHLWFIHKSYLWYEHKQVVKKLYSKMRFFSSKSANSSDYEQSNRRTFRSSDIDLSKAPTGQ